MGEDLLHTLFFSLISGFTEILPVSAPAHQLIYEQLTGRQMLDAGLVLAVHIGCLAALLVSCWKQLSRIRRERRLAKFARRRNSRKPDPSVLMDGKLLRIAAIPLLISIVFYRWAGSLVRSPALLSLILVLNGVILFLPRLLSQGNKDGRSLSGLDGFLIGLGGVTAVIPGFSRMGGLTSTALARGAERSYALNFALLLCIPAMIGMIVLDLYAVATAEAVITAAALLGYLIAAAASFGSGYLGVLLMRFLYSKTNGTGFAYYSWGLALFSFILYLIV